MSEPVDSKHCMRLNERRLAQAMDDLSDEHAPIGSGVMAWMQGTPWMCKAVAADLDAPLTDADVARVVEFYRSRDMPPVIEVTVLRDGTTVLMRWRRLLWLKRWISPNQTC